MEPSISERSISERVENLFDTLDMTTVRCTDRQQESRYRHVRV